MKRTVRRFLRLLRPLLVLAAIITWVSGHTQQAHSDDSVPKFPIEIPMRMEGGTAAIGARILSQFTVTFDQKNERVRLTR